MFAPDADIPGIMSDAEDILQAKVNYVTEAVPDNDWVNGGAIIVQRLC